eukprot:138732-Pelagomonas_calceolata.AAC.4
MHEHPCLLSLSKVQRAQTQYAHVSDCMHSEWQLNPLRTCACFTAWLCDDKFGEDAGGRQCAVPVPHGQRQRVL